MWSSLRQNGADCQDEIGFRQLDEPFQDLEDSKLIGLSERGICVNGVLDECPFNE